MNQTKGQWYAKQEGDSWWVVTDDLVIANDLTEADARLIAQALAMHEALTMIANELAEHGYNDALSIHFVRKALREGLYQS